MFLHQHEIQSPTYHFVMHSNTPQSALGTIYADVQTLLLQFTILFNTEVLGLWFSFEQSHCFLLIMRLTVAFPEWCGSMPGLCAGVAGYRAKAHLAAELKIQCELLVYVFSLQCLQ